VAYTKTVSDFCDSLSVPINHEHRDTTVTSHPSLDILNKKTKICTSDSKQKLTRQVTPCNDSRLKCEETCITLKLLYSAAVNNITFSFLKYELCLVRVPRTFFQAIFILSNFTYPGLGKAMIIASILLHL